MNLLPSEIKHLYFQTPCQLSWEAIQAKFTGADWAIWQYIQMVDPFGEGRASIDIEVLAERLSLSTKQIHRSLKKLKEHGFFEWTPQKIRGQNLAPIYLGVVQTEDRFVQTEDRFVQTEDRFVQTEDRFVQTEDRFVQKHNIDRVCDQTIQTNTNFNQTHSYEEEVTAELELEILQEKSVQEQAKPLADLQIPVESVEKTEKPSCRQIVPATFNKTEQLKKSAKLSEREFEILAQAQVYAFNPAIAPWRDGLTIIKPEVQKAIFDANPQWYSSGNGSVNLKKISDRVKSLERKMRGLGVQAVDAYIELMNYVNMAQTSNSAQVVRDKNEQAKQFSIRNRLATLLDEADHRKTEQGLTS